MKNAIRYLTASISASLYLYSLTRVAFITSASLEGTEAHHVEWTGLKILKSGWLGIFDGTVAWYANPALALAIVLLLAKERLCVPVSVISFVLACTSLAYGKMYIDERWSSYAIVGSWGDGFYFWLASIAIVVIGSFALHSTSSTSDQNK